MLAIPFSSQVDHSPSGDRRHRENNQPLQNKKSGVSKAKCETQKSRDPQSRDDCGRVLHLDLDVWVGQLAASQGKTKQPVSAWLQPEPANWWHVVEDAYAEDLGSGDVTSGCIDPDASVEWYIEAQAEGVVSGIGIAEHLFAPMPHDPFSETISVVMRDGDLVRRGDRIIEGTMNARRLLSSERCALNFIMILSGTATLTSQFKQRVEGTRARIIDTRKTIPNLRALQKYAVRCGGGGNHRMGLFDAVMIKDNHILASGGITEAVESIRGYASHMLKIEVECTSIEQVDEAVKAKVDVVLLDNMDPFMMREAVKRHEGNVLFEASGGISLETVRGVAQTGVDFISVGALTHSAVSLPFHLEVEA